MVGPVLQQAELHAVDLFGRGRVSPRVVVGPDAKFSGPTGAGNGDISDEALTGAHAGKSLDESSADPFIPDRSAVHPARPDQTDGPRVRKATLPCLYVLTVLVGVLGAGLWRLYVAIPVTIRNGYAGMTLAEMLIGYMEANDNAWPHDWEELRPYYDYQADRGSNYCTFEQLRLSVELDFSFSPAEYQAGIRSDREPRALTVVLPRLGQFATEGWEPNAIVRAYLIADHRRRSALVPDAAGSAIDK